MSSDKVTGFQQRQIKKVLMIVLDFPPCRSAGVQRSLRFSEFLPEFGWQPIIVTATENVFDRKDMLLSLPQHLTDKVIRAKAVDATKEYSFNGKYFHWMALPDRYWPWYFDAVKRASLLIEQEKPDIIWSTYPVLTSHLIAKKLHQKYNIPWVADYRDPLQCHYDTSAQEYANIKKWLEKSVISNADKVVMTSEHAAEFYRGLFSQYKFDKFTTIENGFYLSGSNKGYKETSELSCKFTLLYSGMLYINGRDPKPLFSALARLKSKGLISNENFVLNFRATVNNYENYLQQLDISELVNFLPSVSYQEAQVEMAAADVNVLIQDEIFNRQVPGKLYEYIGVRKPILALTPENSATCDVINKFGYGFQADGVIDIFESISFLLNNKVNCDEDIERFSRKHKTAELAQVFDDVISSR